MVIKKKIVITVINYSHNTIKQVRTISFVKPCIVITGMHRSGTSFLARACNLGGVYFGELDELMSHEWKPIFDNKRGHWEHNSIFKTGEKIITDSGGTWHEIPDKISHDENLSLKINNLIENLAKQPSLAFGFKDPRFLITSQEWIPHIPKDFLIMAIFRHPLNVAESLKVRDSFDYEKSIKLWTIYNEKLLSLLEKHPNFVFSFDWDKETMIKELKMVFEKIGLTSTVNFSEWYTGDLLHSKIHPPYELPPETQIIYDKLVELSKKNKDVNVKINCIPENPREIIDSLYLTIQNQGIYFSSLFNESGEQYCKTNLEVLEQIHKTTLENLELKRKLHEEKQHAQGLVDLCGVYENKWENDQKIISSLRREFFDIQNSFTWKTLRKLDKIKHRSQ